MIWVSKVVYFARKLSMDPGLFLAFFAICHSLPLSFSAQEHSVSKSTSTCPEHFECGNLGTVRFPFFNVSELHCGLCWLDCTAPSPKIEFGGFAADRWFHVRNISIDHSIMTLDDLELKDLLASPRRCESFNFNYDMRIPTSPFISYTILQNITLFRCSKNSQTSQRTTDILRGYQRYHECDTYTVYYPTTQNTQPVPPHNVADCAPVTLPTISSWDSQNIFEILTAEFDLHWQVSEDCYSCHNEGKMCPSDWKGDSRCAPEKGTQKLMKIIVGTAIGVGGFVILVILAYCLRRKFSFSGKTNKFGDVEEFLKNYGSLAPKRYYYSEVKKMTNSFKIKLGQGGYGCVYKGKLHDGSPVAVKVLNESKGTGEEFINEVASISRTSHVNVVTLLGFCFQGRKRALIYEFMSNGSLEKFIFGGVSSTDRHLGWKTLYNIAVGIARGLEYLHRGCNTRIVHFDIKPHNILLDENFCPKIADFGLAKLCLQKESIVSLLCARGTFGYIAPEVFCKNIGGVSHKSDVYSYGMMVLEMVGARKNIDVRVDHTSEIYFPHWIYTRLDQGEELGLFGTANEEENELARKMTIVSLWCIQTDPANRPSMSKVVEMLEGNLQALETPPKPFLSSPTRASEESSIMILE